jgi:hypothetical protein
MGPAKLALLFTLNFSLLATVASAQDRPRSVEGLVTYHDGEIAPSATVQIEDVASQQVISCVSDKNGHYRFPALKMDKAYTIRAMKNGHWSEEHHISKFSGKTSETANLRLNENSNAP